MAHYMREYSKGYVKPYRRGSRLVWRMYVDEYIITERTDERGITLLEENGSPRLDRKRHALTKQLDIPCIEYTAKDGSVKYRNVTKAEAAFDEWRNNLLAQAKRDHELAVANEELEARAKRFSYDTTTVDNFLEIYLEERRGDNIEKSTLDGYSHAIKHASAYFKGVPLQDVTVDMLKAFNKSMADLGLGTTTRNRALKMLKFAWDAHRDQISTYPWVNTKKWFPQPKKADPNPLDAKSLARVLDDCQNSPATPFFTAVELAVRTSMRVGEICGLRWADVNLNTGAVKVCNAIGTLKGGKELYEKTPKYTGLDPEHNSTRRAPRSPKVASLLNRRFDYMCAEYKARFATSEDDARKAVGTMYVIGDVRGNYANPTTISRMWRGYSQNLMGVKGRRPTFHGLRSTWISRAITEAGVDPITAATISGHADPGFLMRTYGASDESALVGAQERMDDIL